MRSFGSLVRVCVAASSLLAFAAPAAAQAADAREDVSRGLTLLHEFEYEDANEAFRQAQRLDPGFVMGYWGEAMTYHQALWRHENVGAARSVFARLGRTPGDRRAKCRSAKEAALLSAAEVLFGAGDVAARRRAYADAMQHAHADFPDDSDIAALYALSLLATASRGLIGFSDAHEGHSEGLAGSEIQARAAAVLEAVLKSHPDHRGALHYLLHAYDDPEHASLALGAARMYAKIAGASHALHMPSHIFLQLGLWHDAAVSDRAAYDASTAWVRGKSLGDALRNYHALSWLQYELLQLGRYRHAWQTVGEIEPVVKATGQLNLLSDLSSMRARYVIEARRWDLLAGERNFGNVNELFAIGMSAARTGHGDVAARARGALAERARSEQEGDLRPAIAIMEQEVAALVELAAARRDVAIEMLQAAARGELALPAPFGLPEPVKPAPELLAEVLLESGRPREAMDWFGKALERHQNRSLSVLGLARAAAAIGDTRTASARYGELRANYDHADDELPELREARAALASPSVSSSRPRVVAFAAGGVILVAIAALLRRRLRQSPNAINRPKSRRSRGKTH